MKIFNFIVQILCFVGPTKHKQGDVWYIEFVTPFLNTVPTSLMVFYFFTEGKGKGKAVPLQAWSGPEGSRKLRFPDFMTTAQDGGKVVSLTHRPPLPPGSAPGTHFC